MGAGLGDALRSPVFRVDDRERGWSTLSDTNPAIVTPWEVVECIYEGCTGCGKWVEVTFRIMPTADRAMNVHGVYHLVLA